MHDADRRDFETISRTTARQLFCSRSRRDAEGRLNGVSPLYPADLPEKHRQRARIPEHAAGWSDRLFARPDEFEALPEAESARTCWIDWHTERLTPHDGLIRRNHPVVVGALQRQQSATSLVKLLRDPLGYLWQYGFGWDEPSETEDPLLLDALAFGNLVHATLQTAVSRLEASGSFASATPHAIETALDSALETVATEWEQSQPTPPPVIWRRKLQDIRNLALAALTFSEPQLPGQRSWAEIPFGGDRRARNLTPEDRAKLPWDPMAPVVIPGTSLRIGGSIDRLDLAADGETARVTDYKSGRPPGQNRDLVLKGGAELQRCLYAFAVRSLLPQVSGVSSRLLYLKAADDGLYSLADPDAVLSRLAEFAAAAVRLAAAGNLLPGPAAADVLQRFRLRFAGRRQGDLFRSEISAHRRAPGRSRPALGDGMMPDSHHPPALPDAGARQRALLDYGATLLVEAGAGSGKTALMAGRVALMLAHGIRPRDDCRHNLHRGGRRELLERIERFVASLAAGSVPP